MNRNNIKSNCMRKYVKMGLTVFFFLRRILRQSATCQSESPFCSMIFLTVVNGGDTISFTVRSIFAATKRAPRSTVGPSGRPAQSLAFKLSMVTLSRDAKRAERSLAVKSSSS